MKTEILKEIVEIFVIYNPYKNGYYNGNNFAGILFANKYYDREAALIDISDILKKSKGVEYLQIEKLYTFTGV